MGIRGAPRSVRAAAILCYLAAGLAFISGIALSFAIQLPQLAGFVPGIFWLFMAATIRTGYQWTRFTAVFLFSLGTLATLLEPLNELILQAFGATPYLIVFETLQWLPALAAVRLLWTRGATGYYRQLQCRAQQQKDQQREDRMNRHRLQDRRKRARRASARSRSLSRR